jgi:putative ABC transport system permease protein
VSDAHLPRGEAHPDLSTGAGAPQRLPRAEPIRRAQTIASQLLTDGRRGLETLQVHKLRSLLTMLGMIFGVAAVVSMMSIGAGAQQQVLAFIEQLGVRNLIVEARESSDWQTYQKVRRTSPGLTERDLRVIRANVDGITESTARKRFLPQKLIPKPQRDPPQVFGVEPVYRHLAGLQVTSGRFFDHEDTQVAAAVCVLGEGARARLFGARQPIGQYLKVNEQWFQVIGTVGPQVSAPRDTGGLPTEDRNNLIYVPVTSAILRLEDSFSQFKDEIDGIYLQMESAAATIRTGEIVRGILDTTHGGTDDYSVVVPAQLLAEQRRTQRIFEIVMVALASISLLVGGIGIMNIMLASVLERTREIGVRRAVGATQTDIVRQFLVETVMIAVAGGIIGLLVGVGLSRLIAWLAGWSTIVTVTSIALAFLVSVAVGLVFGVYPARRAARLDPVEALHYE